MKEIALSLREEVESGRYFQEAKRWYFYRFIYPICERNIAFIFALLMLLASVALFNNEALIPRQPNFLNLGFSVEDSFGITPNLIELPDGLANPALALSNHLLTRYVAARESYDYENRKRQFYYVWHNSNEEVYNSFTQQFDSRNPFSLLNIWRDNYIRTVEKVDISNIRWDEGANAYTARANWQVSSLNQITGEIADERWSAIIEYYLSDIKAVAHNQQSLEFKVINYQPNKLR